MAKKMINATYVEGTVYQHSLELKVSGPESKAPGTEFISGVLEVATDDDFVNIVPVHFTYVTATYAKSGKTNDTFTTLKNFIDNIYKTIMKDGAEAATKVRIDSAIGLNEFYSDRNGNEDLVSVKRNEGGFVHVIAAHEKDAAQRNRFDCDIVITNVRMQEADEEKKIPEKAIVKGAIFNFRNDLLPVEFSVINPNAIDYFINLGATQTNPVFTRIRGAQISETIVREIVEESAFFGDPHVREVKNTRKDYVIDWAARETYEWDDESSITAAEFKECIAKREVTLAEMKQRNAEYKASKNQTNTAPATGAFNF